MVYREVEALPYRVRHDWRHESRHSRETHAGNHWSTPGQYT